MVVYGHRQRGNISLTDNIVWTRGPNNFYHLNKQTVKEAWDIWGTPGSSEALLGNCCFSKVVFHLMAMLGSKAYEMKKTNMAVMKSRANWINDNYYTTLG